MLSFITRRLLIGVFLIFGVVTLTFFITRMAPGDPISLVLGENPEIEQVDIDRIRALYGLDDPIITQYGKWLRNLVYDQESGEIRFSLGYSFKRKRPVTTVLRETIPNTLILTALALVIDFVLGVVIGTISAVRQYSLLDKVATLLALFFYSMPSFWLALMLIIVFAYAIPILPGSGMHSADYVNLSGPERVLDVAKHLILPSFALGVAAAASTARYMRASLIEVIGQDFIRTARAKGLPEKLVIMKHAMRNAVTSIITLFGLYLPFLLGGALVVEVIFAWPGMGRVTYDAISQRDYPMVIGNTLVASSMVVMGNLVADVLYGVVDPRIRYE